MEEYFENLQDKTNECYGLAQKARKLSLDPVDNVEIPIARSLAERVVGLMSAIYPQINNPDIVKRILDLESEYGQLDAAVSFTIAEEIAKQKYCNFENQLQAIEAGIRLGFAYNTLGVVSSPIEGFTDIKIGKTLEGKDYFIPCFSGPIRSAGTTAGCMALILIDYLRECFGYAKYDPTELEVKRYLTEIIDYHERVTNLQYFPTEEEIVFISKNLPIQISGDPTESKEVSNFKDLSRIETNFIRGGMCLIFAEGLAQKAQKGLRILKGLQDKGFKISDWDFLEEYVNLHKKREKGTKDTVATYIKDLVAGRPVFGHPSRSGSFRFRYGRSRVSGFSATSVHPATMGISNCFLSSGTQLKIEKPTKGCIITPCDSIEGPIIKLKNGEVRKLKTLEEAKKLYFDTEEIIYFGDLLFPFGDVANRNYDLIKSGYVEEWWFLEFKKSLDEHKDLKEINEFKKVFDSKGFLEDLEGNLLINLDLAISISNSLKIPLHPSFIYYWNQIDEELFFELLYYLHNGVFTEDFILPYGEFNKDKFEKAKRALELLGVEHKISIENLIIRKEDARALLLNLGVQINLVNNKKVNDEVLGLIKTYENLVHEKKKENPNIVLGGGFVLDSINKVSKYQIKDKAGTFIGSRMGRPEKAKLRKLTGSPNALFPVGEEGGRLRSFNEAVDKKTVVTGDFPIYLCKKCNSESIYSICEKCGERTTPLNYCRECKQKFESKICPEHKIGQRYSRRSINIKDYFDRAIDFLGIERSQIPPLIKGVRGTSNEDHTPENLSKGILRAKYGLAVNKDGTIRYDATEAPITHFKAFEIKTDIHTLKKLGYKKDIYGEELVNENQIIELKPHDIILSSCPDTLNEKADDVFFKVFNFIDDLLVNFYHLEPYYKLKNKSDLIGHLMICIAPHNCAGVVARLIGFSDAQVIYASPYIHAACRRDCDGDELAVMSLLDCLLNFSKKFLPSHRGGTQDSPLVLNTRIRAGEVDDQILDFELVSEYPLELYSLSEEGGHHSSEISFDTVKLRLKESKCTFTNTGFTHNVNNINYGVTNSSYKTIPNMQEKVRGQMDLIEKIRAVDNSDVARLIIDRHFIRDLKGNLRKFSQQEFRCVKCNTKYRRVPLTGKCFKCGGKIIFTVSYGSIIKYLEPALELATKYKVPAYIKQDLDLTKMYIESVFGKEKEKQEALEKWF